MEASSRSAAYRQWCNAVYWHWPSVTHSFLRARRTHGESKQTRSGGKRWGNKRQGWRHVRGSAVAGSDPTARLLCWKTRVVFMIFESLLWDHTHFCWFSEWCDLNYPVCRVDMHCCELMLGFIKYRMSACQRHPQLMQRRLAWVSW